MNTKDGTQMESADVGISVVNTAGRVHSEDGCQMVYIEEEHSSYEISVEPNSIGRFNSNN